MWILAAILGLLSYLAVRQYHRIVQHSVSLTIYATDLLLRPELHYADAAQLREIILHEPRDARTAERAAFRAIQQWASNAARTRSGVTLQSIVART